MVVGTQRRSGRLLHGDEPSSSKSSEGKVHKSMSFVGTIDVGVALRPDTKSAYDRIWWRQLVVSDRQSGSSMKNSEAPRRCLQFLVASWAW